MSEIMINNLECLQIPRCEISGGPNAPHYLALAIAFTLLLIMVRGILWISSLRRRGHAADGTHMHMPEAEYFRRHSGGPSGD